MNDSLMPAIPDDDQMDGYPEKFRRLAMEIVRGCEDAYITMVDCKRAVSVTVIVGGKDREFEFVTGVPPFTMNEPDRPAYGYHERAAMRAAPYICRQINFTLYRESRKV